MHEIELKFNVPSHYQASTLQQINTTTAKKTTAVGVLF